MGNTLSPCFREAVAVARTRCNYAHFSTGCTALPLFGGRAAWSTAVSDSDGGVPAPHLFPCATALFVVCPAWNKGGGPSESLSRHLLPTHAVLHSAQVLLETSFVPHRTRTVPWKRCDHALIGFLLAASGKLSALLAFVSTFGLLSRVPGV